MSTKKTPKGAEMRRTNAGYYMPAPIQSGKMVRLFAQASGESSQEDSEDESAEEAAVLVVRRHALPRDAPALRRRAPGSWLESFYEVLYAVQVTEVHVPFTLVFQYGRPYAAYWSENGAVRKSEARDLVLERVGEEEDAPKRSAPSAVFPEARLREAPGPHARGSAGDVRAMYVYHTGEGGAAGASGAGGAGLAVEYLGEAGVQHLLHARPKHGGGVVQRFVPPATPTAPACAAIRVLWTPHLYQVQAVRNRHRSDSEVPAERRCTTFDGAQADVESVPLSRVAEQRVVAALGRLVAAVRAVLPRGLHPTQMVLHFQTHGARLVFTYCSALSVASDPKAPVPAARRSSLAEPSLSGGRRRSSVASDAGGLDPGDGEARPLPSGRAAGAARIQGGSGGGGEQGQERPVTAKVRSALAVTGALHLVRAQPGRLCACSGLPLAPGEAMHVAWRSVLLHLLLNGVSVALEAAGNSAAAAAAARREEVAARALGADGAALRRKLREAVAPSGAAEALLFVQDPDAFATRVAADPLLAAAWAIFDEASLRALAAEMDGVFPETLAQLRASPALLARDAPVSELASLAIASSLTLQLSESSPRGAHRRPTRSLSALALRAERDRHHSAQSGRGPKWPRHGNHGGRAERAAETSAAVATAAAARGGQRAESAPPGAMARGAGAGKLRALDGRGALEALAKGEPPGMAGERARRGILRGSGAMEWGAAGARGGEGVQFEPGGAAAERAEEPARGRSLFGVAAGERIVGRRVQAGEVEAWFDALATGEGEAGPRWMTWADFEELLARAALVPAHLSRAAAAQCFREACLHDAGGGDGFKGRQSERRRDAAGGGGRLSANGLRVALAGVARGVAAGRGRNARARIDPVDCEGRVAAVEADAWSPFPPRPLLPSSRSNIAVSTGRKGSKGSSVEHRRRGGAGSGALPVFALRSGVRVVDHVQLPHVPRGACRVPALEQAQRYIEGKGGLQRQAPFSRHAPDLIASSRVARAMLRHPARTGAGADPRAAVRALAPSHARLARHPEVVFVERTLDLGGRGAMVPPPHAPPTAAASGALSPRPLSALSSCASSAASSPHSSAYSPAPRAPAGAPPRAPLDSPDSDSDISGNGRGHSGRASGASAWQPGSSDSLGYARKLRVAGSGLGGEWESGPSESEASDAEEWPIE